MRRYLQVSGWQVSANSMLAIAIIHIRFNLLILSQL